MQILYYISQLRLTSAIVDAAGPTSVPVLNEKLRPHVEDAEQREGDLVHTSLEEAGKMALDILLDIGDKGIDLLAISVEDEVYARLALSGDIRDCKHKDWLGGHLLKLSQQACRIINSCCTVVVVRNMLPTELLLGHSEMVH